jgi:hypothetical protein
MMYLCAKNKTMEYTESFDVFVMSHQDNSISSVLNAGVKSGGRGSLIDDEVFVGCEVGGSTG